MYNTINNFFIWEEKNSIDHNQNSSQNEEKDNYATTNEIKNDSINKDSNDITKRKNVKRNSDKRRTLHSSCKHCNKSFTHHKASTGIFCNNKCQQDYQSTIIRNQIRDGIYSKVPTRPLIYEMLCEDFGNKCSLCGLSGDNWNGKPIRLWVDHIDGYANNNKYSNFRLICPNCDSQLDTCRAKNKGKGRKSLGLKIR